MSTLDQFLLLQHLSEVLQQKAFKTLLGLLLNRAHKTKHLWHWKPCRWLLVFVSHSLKGNKPQKVQLLLKKSRLKYT